MSTYLKDPDAVLDYAVSWTDWLAAGETIASYTVTPEGVTVDSHSQSGGVVTVWTSGGTVGSTATVAVRITTNMGRTDERTIRLQVRER